MSPEPREASYRFVVAPRFATVPGWAGRLERNGGVELDRARVRPRDDWKPLTAAELEPLVGSDGGRDAMLAPTDLGLMQLPERLRSAWWDEAERSGEALTPGPGDERLLSELVEFFRFKRLPLPEHVSLEVVVSVPGMSSTRTDAAGLLEGLGFGDRVATREQPARQALGIVNLGDEASFIVLLELPPATLVARLEAAGERAARALAPRALVARYFAEFSQQPCLRLRLAPGEGLWLSPFGVVHDGSTQGKRDLDVVLRVGHAGGVVVDL